MSLDTRIERIERQIDEERPNVLYIENLCPDADECPYGRDCDYETELPEFEPGKKPKIILAPFYGRCPHEMKGGGM